MHGYADDTQLYLTFSSARDPEALKRDCRRVEICISEVHTWMTANRLKLNPDKTVAMLVGSPRLLAHISIPLLSIAGVEVAVPAEIANCAAIDAACVLFQLVDDLHRADFGRTGDCASGEAGEEGVDAV